MATETGPGDTLGPTESLDSDEVRNDDGDIVVDPPENWTGADKFGMTPAEQRAGESLGQRLAEEEPDLGVTEPGEPAARQPGTIDEGDDIDQLPAEATDETFGEHRGQIDGAPEDGESFFPTED
ncbi:hypothetical protein IU510_11330 [Nocardia cyriacigeorgica]|uniref:hypothetical protein n=1 Tax=Nocardia cyriacigeorgica TaxID=135487 RepID=UPI001894753B|nr:hypothetical protein [Nocardia cyriacigeorgica]MBF6098671.1 hypothetical protein [Nocardia cyriacigeorgica]MBF6162426.1 hypothetical protein [Nocardia cyriacigeorgica]MBF6201385.1 hypothetical protein [Nocardia cyriacigeorgica]MBF6514499.1 hypothetical protein [Nocardia cyriacigeorgica]